MTLRLICQRAFIPVYRDKEYFRVKPKGYDATMIKALGNLKPSIYSILHNNRISMKRALVKYPFATMKWVFDLSHTLVTSSRGVMVKFMFSRPVYNLFAFNILNG